MLGRERMFYAPSLTRRFRWVRSPLPGPPAGSEARILRTAGADGRSFGASAHNCAPAHDLPGAATEKILALDRSKGPLDAPIGYPGGRHDLLGVGAPDDFLLRVATHSLMLLNGWSLKRNPHRFRQQRRIQAARQHPRRGATACRQEGS